MGASYEKQKTNSNKFQLKGARIWLPLDVLQGQAYASVSPTAKGLLLDLSAQLRANHGEIINNGDLTTALAVLSKRGWKNDKTIRNASKQLENANLIVKTRQGHLPNKANLYAVTWLPLNESDKLDITARGFGFNSYKLKERPPTLKIVMGKNYP